ncbi:MAG TPA: hypothetical protein VFH97_08115 [Gemmatimonadales bacterium]|nr:hypothetical protein [Gemmatimonadales bacterium]
MPRVPFASLPDTARLWVFAAERPLAFAEREALLRDVDAFLDHWAAHGVPLTAGRDWRYDRFLLVAVDQEAAGVSGCSIDALTRLLRDYEGRIGVALLDNGPVSYRSGENVVRVPRSRFAELAQAGDVGPETIVFDNTVATVGTLRAGKWEAAARLTWHGRVFFRDALR